MAQRIERHEAVALLQLHAQLWMLASAPLTEEELAPPRQTEAELVSAPLTEEELVSAPLTEEELVSDTPTPAPRRAARRTANPGGHP